MNDPTQVARLLIESAAALAQATNARAIIAAVDALPAVEAVPPRTLIVHRDATDKEQVDRLMQTAAGSLEIPGVELDRMGQVKLVSLIALSTRTIELGDTVIFLTGPFRSLVDSLVVMQMGSEYELFDTTEQPEIDEHIKRAVFHRIFDLALKLGQHGREGRKVGALLVVGDHTHVLEQSEQMILNPFKGYSDRERNILDDRTTETVKEFSSLDGAFVIRGNGVIETAGARLKAGLSEGLPSGLGARHAAAAGITANTKSIAVTVSESDGTVRVWRAGRLVASLAPSGRRD